MKETKAPRCGRYSRRDWLIAAAVALIVLALCSGCLTRGIPDWGDDNAAYISEGIAIANGEFAQQAQRNLALHPTPFPDEVAAEGMVYVWGFPLLLAPVYLLAGYDTENFSSAIYFKLPSLLCLALLGGVMYLFYRRRFSQRLSALLALLLCLWGDFFFTVDRLYGDVCFLFFAMLALLLVDVLLDSARGAGAARGPSLPAGIALGAALWLACETRLNGFTICIACLCAQLFHLLKERPRSAGVLIRHLLPYLVFFALRIASERLLLPATSNMSDVGSLSRGTFRYHIRSYFEATLALLCGLSSLDLPVLLGFAPLLLCIAGFFACGFRRENLHLTLLFMGTYIVLIMLPYDQGYRYLYGAVPILLLYLGGGARWALRRLPRPAAKPVRRVARLAAAALLAVVIVNSAAVDCKNLSNGRRIDTGMYAAAATDAYRYIQRETPPDAVIACTKPRALYLNTGRMGMRPEVNGHDPFEADYWLLIDACAENVDFGVEAHADMLEPVFAADGVRIYRVLDGGAQRA